MCFAPSPLLTEGRGALQPDVDAAEKTETALNPPTLSYSQRFQLASHEQEDVVVPVCEQDLRNKNFS